MDNNQLSEFEHFLNCFPEIELPVTISSQYFDVFSNFNKVLPQFLINKYIIGEDIVFPDKIVSTYDHHKNYEINSDEELPNNEDEFIACFKLPESGDFHAVVYLKISLLNYDYFLHTFDSAGRSISSKSISGMNSDGQKITEKAALIEDNLKIWIMEGIIDENEGIEQSVRDLPGFYIDEKGKIMRN
jgi:hypothetical protein